MKKVFLTGTNGLLGHNLVIELIDSGYEVKGLVRDCNKYEGPLFPELKLIEGSLRDDFHDHLKDVGVMIHAAAETRQDLPTEDHYDEINVKATLHLLLQAIQAGVKKFIFVSTANTVGTGGQANDLGMEDKSMTFPFNQAYYPRSKVKAEQAILQYQDHIGIVIVNPTFMLGAYDTKPSSGKIISIGSGKPVVFYPPGGKNFVYVKDVAKGIVNAIEKGKNGEKYLLCHENLTLKDFFKKLNRELNKKPLMVAIPRWLLLAAGHIGEFIRKMGFGTSVCVANMEIISRNGFYSNKKSVRELGMEYHPIETALKETLNYFDQRKESGK